MKTFATTAIDSRGRVTVPADVRRHLDVSAGGKIIFVTTDGGSVGIRAGHLTLEDVMGSVEALPNESADLDREILEATEEAIARKMRRLEGQ